MRILLNIINEFNIYKQNILINNENDLNVEKMLALIVFKNLYPKDFEDLQRRKGIIKKAFDEKEKHINELCQNLSNEKKAYEEEIELQKKENLKNIKEVKDKILSRLTENQGLFVKMKDLIHEKLNLNLEYTKEEIMSDDFAFSDFDMIKECTIEYSYANQGNIEKKIDNFQEIYSNYKKQIDEFLNFYKRNHHNHILNIDKEIKEISNLSLKELVRKYTINEVFSEDVKKNELLTYLLYNGYIDEYYFLYINYYREMRSNPSSIDFINSVLNRDSSKYDLDLNDSDIIVNMLELHHFSTKAIYNFDLLNYMLSIYPSQNNDKLKQFIEQLSDESAESWEFIKGFLEYIRNYNNQNKDDSKKDNKNIINIEKSKSLFIKLLSESWINMWNYIYDSEENYEIKINYLSLLIQYSDINLLEKMDKDKKITKFFQEKSNVLSDLPKIITYKIIDLIANLQIIFYDINIDGANIEVLNYIFDNNLYDLNPIMITKLYNYKNNNLSDNNEIPSYTEILSLEYQPLIQNIKNNLERYINDIFLQNEKIDSPDAISDLLLKSLESLNLVYKIINSKEFKLDHLPKNNDNYSSNKRKKLIILYYKLLSSDKILASWKILADVYKESCKLGNANIKLNNVIESYIENHINELSTTEFPKDNERFIDAILKSDVIKKFPDKIKLSF